MNILKARNQLHQISQNNPEIDHFDLFDSNIEPANNNFTHNWKLQRHPRILHSHHQQAHLFKDQTIRTIQEKSNPQEKVQVKTPIFKNKKAENFTASQKQRFEKLGLQNFLNQSSLNQNPIQKPQEPIEQKIIKNLNNTYFRSTEHIHGKRKNMTNSLGIKKSSMSNYKVDWDQKNMNELEIEWKYIGYIPNKVFPCRKNNSAKNKIIYSPKKKHSLQTDIQEIGQKLKTQEKNFMEKSCSISFLQNKDLGTKNSLFNLNEKVTSLHSSKNIHNDQKIFIDTSKILNKSQELIARPQISRILTIDKAKSIAEKSNRPWTSKQAFLRNQKITDRLNSCEKSPRKRRYSQSTHRTAHTFKESWRKEKPSDNNCLLKYVDIQDGSDFIKGKKINLYQVPEQRINEYF